MLVFTLPKIEDYLYDIHGLFLRYLQNIVTIFTVNLYNIYSIFLRYSNYIPAIFTVY